MIITLSQTLLLQCTYFLFMIPDSFPNQQYTYLLTYAVLQLDNFIVDFFL